MLDSVVRGVCVSRRVVGGRASRVRVGEEVCWSFDWLATTIGSGGLGGTDRRRAAHRQRQSVDVSWYIALSTHRFPMNTSLELGEDSQRVAFASVSSIVWCIGRRI